jgi:hypothetical protein
MNYKIILGLSTVTILTLIYQYVKNLFNPNKRLLEGQISTEIDSSVIDRRYGESNSRNINPERQLNLTGREVIDNAPILQGYTRLLRGLYDELGEFNHIYQERMFENLIPTQIRKTIVHLSSVDHSNNIFDLASTETSGLSTFKNVVNFKLLSAQIPYVPHNIYNDNNNNALKFNNLNDISIVEGYYTIYSLLNSINTTLTTNITLTFNNVTKLITINNPDLETIITDTSTHPLFKRLGFNENINSSNTTINASNIPDLSIHFIDIVYANIHPRASTQTTDDGNILKRIPLNGQPGDMIYYDTPHSDYISQELFNPDINSNIPTIELQFKRNDKSIYDFKGLHYDLKIEVTELVEPTILNELASHMRRDRKRFIDEEGSVEIGGIDYVLGNMDVSKK